MVAVRNISVFIVLTCSVIFFFGFDVKSVFLVFFSFGLNIITITFKAPLLVLRLGIDFVINTFIIIITNVLGTWGLYSYFVDYMFLPFDFCERYHYSVDHRLDFNNMPYFLAFLKALFPLNNILLGLSLLNYVLCFELFIIIFKKFLNYLIFGDLYSFKLLVLYVKLILFYWFKIFNAFLYSELFNIIYSLFLKLIFFPIFALLFLTTALVVVWCLFYLLIDNINYYNSRTYYYDDNFEKNVNSFFEKELLEHNKSKIGSNPITISGLKKATPLLFKGYLLRKFDHIDYFVNRSSNLFFCDNFLNFKSVVSYIINNGFSVTSFKVSLKKPTKLEHTDELSHIKSFYSYHNLLSQDIVNDVLDFNKKLHNDKSNFLSVITSKANNLINKKNKKFICKNYADTGFLDKESSIENGIYSHLIFLSSYANGGFYIIKYNYIKFGAYLELWDHHTCTYNEYYEKEHNEDIIFLLLFNKNITGVKLEEDEEECLVEDDYFVPHDVLSANNLNSNLPIISPYPLDQDDIDDFHRTEVKSTDLETSSNGDEIVIVGARDYSSKKIKRLLKRNSSQNSFEKNEASYAFRSVMINRYNVNSIKSDEASAQNALVEIKTKIKNNNDIKHNNYANNSFLQNGKKNNLKLNLPDDIVVSIMFDSLTLFLKSNEDLSGSSKNIMSTSDAVESDELKVQEDIWDKDDLKYILDDLKANNVMPNEPFNGESELKEIFDDSSIKLKSTLTSDEMSFTWLSKNSKTLKKKSKRKQAREVRKSALVYRWINWPRYLLLLILKYLKLDFDVQNYTIVKGESLDSDDVTDTDNYIEYDIDPNLDYDSEDSGPSDYSGSSSNENSDEQSEDSSEDSSDDSSDDERNNRPHRPSRRIIPPKDPQDQEEDIGDLDHTPEDSEEDEKEAIAVWSEYSWTDAANTTEPSLSDDLNDQEARKRLSSSSEDDAEGSIELAWKTQYGLRKRIINDNLFWHNTATSSLFFKNNNSELSSWLLYFIYIRSSLLSYIVYFSNVLYYIIGLLNLFINDRCSSLIFLYKKKMYYAFVITFIIDLTLLYLLVLILSIYIIFSVLLVLMWIHIVTALVFLFYSKFLLIFIYPAIYNALSLIFTFFISVVASVQKISVINSWWVASCNVWFFFNNVFLELFEILFDIVLDLDLTSAHNFLNKLLYFL